MNTYICMIDLKPNANALAFANAAQAWLDRLVEAGRIDTWQLQRRKLHLAGPGFGDFMLFVQFGDLAQLDLAFGYLGEGHEGADRAYDLMHGMIDRVEVGLYRPYPDPEPAERLALV